MAFFICTVSSLYTIDTTNVPRSSRHVLGRSRQRLRSRDIKMARRAGCPGPGRIAQGCSMIGIFARLLLTTLPLLAASIANAEETMAEPETVYFESADDTTEIVGYLFKPHD